MTDLKFVRGMGFISHRNYDNNSFCYSKSGRLSEIGFRICLRKTC